MHKLIAALIASTLVVGAYAQTAATPAPDAPAAQTVKKQKTHAHKTKHAHKVKKDASST